MRVMAECETGVSGNTAVQSVADRLVEACCKRLCRMLAAARMLPAQEERALPRLLDPLQHMLNDEQRRHLWRSLHFELQRVRKAKQPGLQRNGMQRKYSQPACSVVICTPSKSAGGAG